MTNRSIGVAVIGGGMAGRAHAAGYRSATTLFGTDRPDVRLVSIADTNRAVGTKQRCSGTVSGGMCPARHAAADDGHPDRSIRHCLQLLALTGRADLVACPILRFVSPVY